MLGISTFLAVSIKLYMSRYTVFEKGFVENQNVMDRPKVMCLKETE